MFGIKKMLMKKMLDQQLKGVPQKEKDRIIAAVTENPEFFEKIGKEIEAEVKHGKSQMTASMEVMRKYQGQIQELMK